MNLEEAIITAFQNVKNEPIITDDFIEHNQSIMEIMGDIDYFKHIPAYMLWCLRKKDSKLVDMYTVDALAVYGRSKIKDKDCFNFKWRCNTEQRKVIFDFLKWCEINIITADTKQIERTLKNWSM